MTFTLLAYLAGVCMLSSEVCAGEISLGIAAGLQTSPFEGEEDQALVVPVLGYEGERFNYFLDTASYMLLGQESGDDAWRVCALAKARIFDRADRSAGMQKRHSTVDVGAEAAVRGPWGGLSLQFLSDALKTHEGSEVSLTYVYELHIGEKFSISPSLGLSYYSERLADYYFGVRAAEALPSRAEYHPGRTAIATSGLTATYQLPKHWTLVSVLEVMRLDDALADSPIVSEQYTASVALGALYQF